MPDKSKSHQGNHVGNGLHNSPVPEASFMSGLKQRLLSFIFRGLWNEEADQAMVSVLV